MDWKVAIVGCGGFARGQYMKDIDKVRGARLVGVCDIIPERAKEYGEAAKVPWFVGIDNLLANCDFDILMDAASIPAHHELNMKALAAGKHVFSQKPAALSVENVTRQIELARQMGVKSNAAPVHAMRHANRMAKQMLRDGVIGRPTTIRCQVVHGGPEYFQYRDVHPGWFYEADSGALFDMGVHALHYVTDLFGPAKRVNCMAAVSQPLRLIRTGAFDGQRMRTDKLPDNYIICLDFGGGVIGEVYTGYCVQASRMPQMEIYGDMGTIAFMDDGLDVYCDHPGFGLRGWTRAMDLNEPEAFFCDTFCLQDLIDAIEQDRAPVLSMERQRHLVEIMCAIPKALETGGAVELTTTFEGA